MGCNVRSGNGKQLVKAVNQALNKVIGAYAIVVMEKSNSNHLVAARKASPLVIGLSNDNTEFFVGSDATPLVEYTRKVIYLEDEQIADINIGKDIEITNLDETSADITIKDVDLDISALSKAAKQTIDLVSGTTVGITLPDKNSVKANTFKIQATYYF